MTDDHPTMHCPRCGREEPDMDGFGFLGRCDACGFCNHPSSGGDPLRCECCGETLCESTGLALHLCPFRDVPATIRRSEYEPSMESGQMSCGNCGRVGFFTRTAPSGQEGA